MKKIVKRVLITLGSTSYLVNEKYLFTGDALSLIDGKVKELSSVFHMDAHIARESIDKLSKLENIIYLQHTMDCQMMLILFLLIGKIKDKKNKFANIVYPIIGISTASTPNKKAYGFLEFQMDSGSSFYPFIKFIACFLVG